MAVVIPYLPRPQFDPYHNRKERFAKIVAHRRFGKTVGCINELIKSALTNTRNVLIPSSYGMGVKKDFEAPPRYSYVAPTYTQAKDIAWAYLKHYSAPIPDIKISESELWIGYPNGGRIRLYGADNYDRMRGLYNDGVIIDEPAQMDPRAWPEVIRPTLSDYMGWATFIGTPQGKDWFYRIDKAEDLTPLPDFFRLTLKASETGVIPPAELASLRAGMSEDQYNREMECSFEAAIEGAYFARLLNEAKAQGRVGRVAADPLLPKRAYIDIGGSGRHADAFTIWIVQFVAHEIRVLHYYEAIGQVLGFHLNWLRKNGYDDVVVRLPHDGINENNITGKRYEDHIREAGFKVEPSLPNQGRGAAQMRIEAVRRILPKCWFNESTTGPGIEALMAYHEKRDEERNVGLGPDHNWASHAADAFGLMAVCYEEPSRSAGFARAIKYPEMGLA